MLFWKRRNFFSLKFGYHGTPWMIPLKYQRWFDIFFFVNKLNIFEDHFWNTFFSRELCSIKPKLDTAYLICHWYQEWSIFFKKKNGFLKTLFIMVYFQHVSFCCVVCDAGIKKRANSALMTPLFLELRLWWKFMVDYWPSFLGTNFIDSSKFIFISIAT